MNHCSLIHHAGKLLASTSSSIAVVETLGHSLERCKCRLLQEQIKEEYHLLIALETYKAIFLR